MKDNILITGGAGFIGSNIALKLLEKGYKVRILDNLSPQIHGKDPEKSSLYMSIKNKVDFIIGSVCSKDDWRKALKNIDVVIHLAAETGTGQSMYDIEKYVDTNIKGTALLWEILTNEKYHVKKVIVAASRAVYGEGRYECKLHGEVYPGERKLEDLLKGDFELKCPICNSKLKLVATTENSKISYSSVYGLTKDVQEKLSLLIGKSIGIPVVAYRYQNVYGPGQSLKNPYTGILSIFSTRIKNGHDINIFEDGKESRDFVYIDDVVKGTILSIENEKANYQVFNIGTGKNIDVLTVARTLKELYNSDIKIEISKNFRLGDIRHNFADITKAKEILGYTPEYDFNRGIKKFVEWVNTQNIEEDNYEKSIEEMKAKGLYK